MINLPLRGQSAGERRSRRNVIPFLLNPHPSRYLMFLSVCRSRRMEKTQVGRDSVTHTHALPTNFPWFQPSISLPTDTHSSLVVSLELNRGRSDYCPSDLIDSAGLPLKNRNDYARNLSCLRPCFPVDLQLSRSYLYYLFSLTAPFRNSLTNPPRPPPAQVLIAAIC